MVNHVKLAHSGNIFPRLAQKSPSLNFFEFKSFPTTINLGCLMPTGYTSCVSFKSDASDIVTIIAIPILYLLFTGPLVAIGNYYNPRDVNAIEFLKSVMQPAKVLYYRSNLYKSYISIWANIGPQYCMCGIPLGHAHR